MARKQKMPALTRKWVEALRSGNYPQTNGCLKNDEGFCCLGVAADVMAPSAWLKTQNEDGEYRFRNSNTNALLPDEDWLRLAPKNVKYKNPDYDPNCDWDTEFFDLEPSQDDMAELNDSSKLNFNQIADIIESWWTDNPIDPNDNFAVEKFFKNKKK